MDVPRGYMDTLAGMPSTNAMSAYVHVCVRMATGSLQPLTGAQQNASGVPPIPTHCPSAAITDVSENMRAKIYALCYKMGMSYAHATAHSHTGLVMTGFQYPHEELSVEDRITICVIESYLDFKVCQCVLM